MSILRTDTAATLRGLLPAEHSMIEGLSGVQRDSLDVALDATRDDAP